MWSLWRCGLIDKKSIRIDKRLCLPCFRGKIIAIVKLLCMYCTLLWTGNWRKTYCISAWPKCIYALSYAIKPMIYQHCEQPTICNIIRHGWSACTQSVFYEKRYLYEIYFEYILKYRYYLNGNHLVGCYCSRRRHFQMTRSSVLKKHNTFRSIYVYTVFYL